MSRTNGRSIFVDMARVTQEHLDARRQQILDASRRCFIRNGFHTTSMQDILSEANLSSGALYRYFRSKEEIIVAIAQDVLAQVAHGIESALEPDVPLSADAIFSRLFLTIERIDAEQDIARMAVQVWGEALRSPVVAEQVRVSVGQTLQILAARIRIYQELGSISSGVAPEHMARAVVSVLPGFILQRALLGDIDAATFGSAFSALLSTEPTA